MTGAPRLTVLAALPVGLLSVYVLFLALVLHPTFQAHNVFLHKINIPFHRDLKRPDTIRSIGKGRARNFYVTTADGVRIAGWHIVPDSYAPAPGDDRDAAHYDRALLEAPVVLYFHGNAMNRAAPVRVQAYRTFTALNVNVVAIDYRGFGDSQGTPSEQGLLHDARAAYRWIGQRQGQAEGKPASDPALLAGQILVSGQSLGTGVASRLTLDLIEAGRPTRAVLLLAPYINIRQLLTSYRIGGFLPVFWPLGLSRSLTELADRYLYTRFESDKALYIAARGGLSKLDEEERRSVGNLDYQLDGEQLRHELGIDDVRRPENTHFVISHADNDLIIPHSHGRTLFDRIHDSLARVIGGAGENGAAALGAASDGKSNDSGRNDLEDQIRIEDLPWGTLLTVAPHPGQQARLTLFKSRKGGHNGVPPHALDYFVNVAAMGSDVPASRSDGPP